MSKLQYVLRASPAYLCREELRIFVQGTFWFFRGSGERVLEGDVRKQAVFPVSFAMAVLVVGEQEISCIYELCGWVGGNFSFLN